MIPKSNRLDAIVSFIDYVHNMHCSEHTLRAYRQDLSKLRDFVGDNQINQREANLFVQYLSQEGLSSSTIRRIISTCSSFYKYLNIENPFDKIRLPRLSQQIPVAVAREVVEAALKNIVGTDFIDIRDRAIIQLLVGSGARSQELLDIRLSDIDFSRREILVTGKGDKERLLVCSQAAVDSLIVYISIRETVSPYCDTLFLSRNGDPLSPKALYNIVQKRMGTTGVDVSPHVLRHTFATEVLDATDNFRAVQELLGHADPKTTMRYAQVSQKKLHEIVDRTFGS